MDDASGRFTNGFFWGNSYFTGSATECDYIGQDYSRKNSDKVAPESPIEEVREFNAEPRKKINLGGSGTGLLETLSFDDRPPYRLGFYMMRFSLNASRYTSVSTHSIDIDKQCDLHTIFRAISPRSFLFLQTRVIHLGVCLPFSCTASDVTVISKFAASDFVLKHSTIEKVRDQHNQYDMYTDPVFWILL